ncbi:MAG: cellulase family glycosylhydrolase [Candidatus Eremiobacteraeota bacterium]|nr:cellulase family glycosylhydrolase [Candidatus Eremiobacteraeota bacterium]
MKRHRWLPATVNKLPRWRGFNLLEKFSLGNERKPFLEEDFRLIAKLGFNFVRLPMDYRCWIRDGDWEQFDEATLREIDQAIEWGRQYGIHVCLNFHRAPGYTVAKPPEARDLWTDNEAQRVCALHWAMFARRYRGIPSERVSFNLINEPGAIDHKKYTAVVRRLVAAIRAEDPNRLIIADGVRWGTEPVPILNDAGIAQATRGYTPLEISHYQASWVGGERFARPSWPRVEAPGYLYGPMKKEWAVPMVIEGPFRKATELRLHVQVVSYFAKLVVEADGKVVLDKEFQCGPGEGEWKKSYYLSEFMIFQNFFDRDYTAAIPARTRQVIVHLAEGDWLLAGEMGLKQAGSSEDVLAFTSTWGRKPEAITWCPGAPEGPFKVQNIEDRQWLWQKCIMPWKEAEAMGIGVFVGEWGAFSRTPHDVTLRWMKDCLTNWKKASWGWALWNFRGSFGILDSGRDDVTYEEFEGHKLDRRMLDLLQRY